MDGVKSGGNAAIFSDTLSPMRQLGAISCSRASPKLAHGAACLHHVLLSLDGGELSAARLSGAYRRLQI
jgi:hypothetical protein